MSLVYLLFFSFKLNYIHRHFLQSCAWRLRGGRGAELASGVRADLRSPQWELGAARGLGVLC